MPKMEKILVIQTASIGDVILVTSLLEKLHHKFPAAQLDVVVKHPNEKLFENHPFVNYVWVWDKRKDKYANLLRICFGIRRQRYDVVLCVQRFFSAGLMTALSKATHRIGFDKNPLAFYFTKRKPHLIQKGIHEIDRNISLLDHVWCKNAPKPELYPSEKDFAAIEKYTPQTYYTISPCSLWNTKTLQEDKWLELCHYIQLNRPEAKLYLLGSKADREKCERMRKRLSSDRVTNLCGELSFLQSAALMKGAEMNFVCDSAPLHLCSAVDAPVTAVFCCTTPDFGFGPLSSDSLVVEAEPAPECKPCGLHGAKACKRGDFLCSKNIDMAKLYERV